MVFNQFNRPVFHFVDNMFLEIFVYQKGDIVKDPMKSIPFLPKIVPGVGWGRVGWGVSCRGGVCHVGVGCHAGVGCGGVGGMCHEGVGWGWVGICHVG